jgi:hypothetical protein
MYFFYKDKKKCPHYCYEEINYYRGIDNIEGYRILFKNKGYNGNDQKSEKQYS